ncbi:MAG: glycosyltransferase family 2 protein [Nocardioidaceae bacterium]
MDESRKAPEQPQLHPTVTAVVLAYGEEPLLGPCLDAILNSCDVDVDLVLVDNGCTSPAVDQFERRSRVKVTRPGRNTGFAAGCNLGAQSATGDVVAFVNSDALIAPDALSKLAGALSDPNVGLASASVRLLASPQTMNSAGNPMHYLGLSWAGGMGEPVAAHQSSRDVASASGALMAARRETWTRLGGFWGELFAYYEDAELSLRCWQQNLRVRYVPEAVALHNYEFSRNARKLYLLERNRLLLLLTLFERRSLLLFSPAILVLELAVLAVATRQGWAREKIAGWKWIATHTASVRKRRSLVQGARRCSDCQLSGVLTAGLEPHGEAGLSVPAYADRASRVYWRCIRRLI